MDEHLECRLPLAISTARPFDLVREMRDAYNHWLRLVESVTERGIKPKARLLDTSALHRLQGMAAVAPFLSTTETTHGH